MSRVPLLGHASLDDIFAAQNGRNPIHVRDFLTDVADASLLPAGKHLLNLCQNRYHFAPWASPPG